MTVIHKLVITKQPGNRWMLAECGCGHWGHLDTDGDTLTREYQAHKASTVKAGR